MTVLNSPARDRFLDLNDLLRNWLPRATSARTRQSNVWQCAAA